MKKFLPAVLCLIVPVSLVAQVTSPIVKANFGVDADLRANFFNGAILTGNDDWYRNNGTVGEGIIDTTGAAFILSRYATNLNYRKIPFFRGMKFPQFSVVNNRLLIDGIFIRDYHGDDSTVFASGSNKNGMSPGIWSCPVSQGIPDKNDILDIFMHVRRAGPNGTDSLWLFAGASIENTTGDRYFDYEMYQTDIFYDRTTRQFYGYGPDAGHTSWQFDAMGNITKAGDIIFTAEYGTSGISLLEARIWIDKSSLLLTPSTFTWGGQFDGDGNAATFGYANILPKGAGDFYTGLSCGNNTWAGPFQLVRQDNSLVANYSARQFMEFSVNLSKLGLDPYITSSDPCGMPFRRIMIKTRASNSFTAELKDFVGPFDFFRAPRANAAAVIPLFCGSTGVTDINVTNPLLTSLYTWTTPNGHIVSDPAGPSITVDMPGTYIVRQELMDSCGSSYASDTVVVATDPNCIVLKTNILNFNARKEGAYAQLRWLTSANRSASYFQVERSMDNINYVPVGQLSRQGEQQNANYSFNDNIAGYNERLIYYRLRIVDINGNTTFSKIVAVSANISTSPTFAVAPNPVKDQAQLAFTTNVDANLDIRIYSASGKLVHSVSTSIFKGSSLVTIPEVQTWPRGIYVVRASIGGEMLTQKMTLVK